MPIETFEDLERLRDDESPKYSTLEALYSLYYSADATSPSSVDRFTEELKDKLGRVTTPLAEDDIEPVLGILTTEINTNHGGSPGAFAHSFLLHTGWLSAETLSDATGLFQEMWLDEATGNYYDELGNWYDHNRQPITATPQPAEPSAATPEMWLDPATGLYYDARGNWYDTNHQPLANSPDPDVAVDPVQSSPAAQVPDQNETAGDGEAPDDAKLAALLAAANADPRDLGWVTAEQRGQLDELTQIKGDWHSWLPGELDRRRPDWTTLNEPELLEWFDVVLPMLALPGADEVFEEALAEFDTDKELQLLTAKFSAEELAEIVEEFLSSRESV